MKPRFQPHNYALYVNNFSTLIFFSSDLFLLLSNNVFVSLDQMQVNSSGIAEYEAIEKAIKIIRKKLVKQAIMELEAAKKDWRVVDGEKAKFYDRIFKNRKIVQEVETSKN